jgi:hypothetical protein
MRRALLQNLRIREDTIRETWRSLLDGSGDADHAADELKRRIDGSVDQIFSLFGDSSKPSPVIAGAIRTRVPSRECGNNPCPDFFQAGERAFRRALEMVLSKLPAAARREIDLGEVMLAVHLAAHHDTVAFCETCPQRAKAMRCRYREAVRAPRARR